jgi:hypothetical protein
MNGVLHHLIQVPQRSLLGIIDEKGVKTKNVQQSKVCLFCTKVLTLRVKHGRETAKLKAITRVLAQIAAPTNGGFIT